MTWSYIAGFFDGEGTLCHNGRGYRVCITQTNKEELKKIMEFTGYGNVVEITKRKSHWKDSWLYFISKQENIYRFLIGISKDVIVKKHKVEETIPILKMVIKKMKEKNKKRIKLYRRAKYLRKNGLTYREIGKILKIDFGQARRIILK